MNARRHKVEFIPERTPKGRTSWRLTCTCSHSSGSYISEASVRAAGSRHLVAVGQVAA